MSTTADNSSASDSSASVGVDLGATLTRAVLVDATGAIGPVTSVPTAMLGAGAPAQRIAKMIDLIEAVAAGQGSIRSIGIGASGPIGSDGVIHNADTLPAFTDLVLTVAIEGHFDVPCLIDNDAVTAAIGEYHRGAGNTASRMIMVTLGTGIGVAVLCDGVPSRGGDGEHPEAGHISVPGGPAECYCGLASCWEQVASRRALEHLAMDVIGRHASRDSPQTAVEELGRRAAGGDEVARTAMRAYGRSVGHGLATLVAVHRPNRVVLGGSAAQHLDLFEPGMRESMRRSDGYSVSTDICAAVLGDASGAVGAALLVAR